MCVTINFVLEKQQKKEQRRNEHLNYFRAWIEKTAEINELYRKSTSEKEFVAFGFQLTHSF